MKNLLIRFALWLLSKCGYQQIALPESILSLAKQAAGFILDNEGWDASGEAKRHRTYAAMIKAFPEAARHEIALAIELAILEMRRG